MDDDFESLRKRVMLESNAVDLRLTEIHALSEQALDAQASLSNGLTIVTTQQVRADEKIDDLKASVATLNGYAQAAVKAWPLIRALLIMPTAMATFVLLRVLWILRGSIFEDAQALLALVSP